jgi:hypothetical protein
MALIAALNYDPAVAVTKSGAALQAMTAMDTVNLRLTFTPTKATVFVRLSGTLHGATTLPQVLMGIMSGATVVGKSAPMTGGGGTVAATSLVRAESTFAVPVTPGVAVTWDAAWSVETLVAATGIKYGGPNDATANNAFGGFGFEVYE